MNKLSEYAVKVLKQYAKEKGNTVRSTTDLSPLEEWLIMELYFNGVDTSRIKTKERTEMETKTNERTISGCY